MPRRPRTTYNFGSFEFTSKDAVRKFFASIRESVGVGRTVEDADHLAALRDLFSGHKEYSLGKAGSGVKRFFVDYAPDHPNTTCFWIERNDGSETEFGLNACMDTVAALNRQSLRALIRPQIYEFRDRRLPIGSVTFVSDYSGETFPAEAAHVDHEVAFEEIVIQFGKLEGLDIENEMLTVTCDARSEPTWKDDAVAARFLAFHATLSLRLVSRGENLSTLRRSEKAE